MSWLTEETFLVSQYKMILGQTTFKRNFVQGDDYITKCLLDYPSFKKYYKMIAIGLSK